MPEPGLPDEGYLRAVDALISCASRPAGSLHALHLPPGAGQRQPLPRSAHRGGPTFRSPPSSRATARWVSIGSHRRPVASRRRAARSAAAAILRGHAWRMAFSAPRGSRAGRLAGGPPAGAPSPPTLRGSAAGGPPLKGGLPPLRARGLPTLAKRDSQLHPRAHPLPALAAMAGCPAAGPSDHGGAGFTRTLTAKRRPPLGPVGRARRQPALTAARPGVSRTDRRHRVGDAELTRRTGARVDGAHRRCAGVIRRLGWACPQRGVLGLVRDDGTADPELEALSASRASSSATGSISLPEPGPP